MAAGDMFLDNLEEFVFDENRIVTYKWLSQMLQVHVNQAKQMLYKFFNQQRDKDANSIDVTYLVSGLKENDNGEKIRKVSIVNSHDLEKHKTNLQEVSGVHIYSVQKTQLKDSNSLYATDYDLTLEQIKQGACSRFSAIKCTEAKTRSETEIAELEERARLPDGSTHQSNGKSTNTSGQSAGSMNGKPSSTTSVTSVGSMNGKPSSTTSDQNNVTKTETVKPASKTNSQPKKGQRSAMDMFTSMKAKTEKDTVAGKTSKDTVAGKTSKDTVAGKTSSSLNKKKTDNKSSKGMLAFMSNKPKEDREEEKKETEETREEKKHEKEKTIETVDVKKEEKKLIKGTSKNKKSTNQKADTKQTKIQKKSKRNVELDSDEESNPKKKQRRRIMMAESSSDEEEDSSDDEPIPPSPPPQQAVMPVDNDAEEEMECEGPSKDEGGTRVRRVRVGKKRQVLDDDGFMVTEKYYEYENMEVADEQKPSVEGPHKKSVSDETENKKVKGKKTKVEKTSQPTTQKSLMSFFKKS